MQQKEQTIILNNIEVKYGENIIFNKFSFLFQKGINVILGKSGCGKTTLLNVIMGLINFTGECVTSKPSVVFSEPTLAPVSVENNVRLVLGKNCDKEVLNALMLARIIDKRKQNALTLSDGEKQRVALARAFACKRSLLLLDEPFSRLDYGVKRQLYNTLIDYLQKNDITTLLVTHDIDEALTLADRIYFLNGKPCNLRPVSELTVSQKQRDIFDETHNVVRKQLQQLFMD